MNVVVSRSPFLPLFPPHSSWELHLYKISQKRTNEHSSSIFPSSPIQKRPTARQQRRNLCCTHTVSPQSSRDPTTIGARNQKGKLHRLFGRAVAVPLYTLSPLCCAAPYSVVHQHFCTISIESTTIVSRRGGQQQQHRITFTQRDFGIVGSKTSKKGAKILPQLELDDDANSQLFERSNTKTERPLVVSPRNGLEDNGRTKGKRGSGGSPSKNNNTTTPGEGSS